MRPSCNAHPAAGHAGSSSSAVRAAAAGENPKLRAKYIGIRIHDHEDGDSDDSNDDGYDEVREINGIEFQGKKPKGFQGKGWKKGYKLVTAEVVDGGRLDDSKEALVPYEIKEEFHTLITAAVNPTRALLKKPAIGDAEQ